MLLKEKIVFVVVWQKSKAIAKTVDALNINKNQKVALFSTNQISIKVLIKQTNQAMICKNLHYNNNKLS